jgi:hypothetical protein
MFNFLVLLLCRYESAACWVDLDYWLQAAVLGMGYSYKGGTHAVGHALAAVVPLFVHCDPRDVGTGEHNLRALSCALLTLLAHC